MSELAIRNRQRVRRVNLRLLRLITKAALTDLLGMKNYQLGIHLVAAPEMTCLNETFLQHEGSTDVITFDHSELRTQNSKLKTDFDLHGELFICVDDAIKQAKEFKTNWQSELVRYLIHGILHLLGHDDTKTAVRAKMKREENRLLRKITRSFPIANVARQSSRRVNRQS